MKNSNILLILSVVLLALGFASCNQLSDYQSVIPDNPVAVLKADVGSMIEKSDVLNDNQVTGFLKNGINEMPEGSRELMRSILDDPSNSGVDFSKPAFVILESLTNARGFALMAVNDVEKVKNLINSLEENDIRVITKENYNVLKVDDENQAAFDENKLVIAFADGAFDATEYITPNERKGDKPAELNNVISSSNDMALYISYDEIMKLAESAEPEIMAAADFANFKNLKFISTLDFENGKAVLNCKTSGNEELINTYKKYVADPESDLQKFVPKATYGFMQFGAKEYGTAIEEAIAKLPNNNPLKEAIDELNEELESSKFSFDLLNSIDGGIILSVSEIDESSDMEMPQIALVAQCKDNNLFKFITNLLETEGAGVQKIDENVLSFNNLVYFGYADNKMFVLTSKIFNECYSNNSLKALGENLSDNAISDLLGNESGIIIDTKAIATLMEQLGMARYRSDRAFVNTIRKFNSTHITIDPSNGSAEWVLTFDDPNTNSLKQIKDMAVTAAIDEAMN